MTMRKIALIVCSVFLILMGIACGRIAPYRSEPLCLTSTDLSQQVEEALATQSFLVGDLPERHWWRLFKDPQLEHLIALALVCNPTIQMAESRIFMASSEAKVVGSALLPYVAFRTRVDRQRVSDFSSLYLPGLIDLFTETTIKAINATYELDLWKKNSHLFWAELDEVQAAICDREEAALILATEVARVYFDLQSNQLFLSITKGILNRKKRALAILMERLENGVISQFRSYEVDQQVAELEDRVAVLEGNIQNNQISLQALVGNACGVGCEAAQLQQVPKATFFTPFPLPANLPLDLLARRPEITAQKWRIQTFAHRMRAAKANFYPNINLDAFFGFQSIELSKLLTAQTFNILAGGALNLPLFDAGKRQGLLSFQQNSYEHAVESYNLLILNAIEDVSTWMSNLVTADQRQQIIERSLADARALSTLTDQRLENGVDDLLPALNAQINVLEQEEIAAAIQLARLQAALGVIKALGGGYYECF